jgi:acyl-CoA thioesterase
MNSTGAGVRVAEAMFAADRASRLLGMEVRELAPGRAVVSMPITEAMLNGFRIAHGGYVFTLADTAFALACNSRGVRTVARACEIVFLRSCEAGDLLRATAVERVRAGRSGVYDVTVVRGEGEGEGEVVAEFRGQSAAAREEPAAEVNGGMAATGKAAGGEKDLA